MAQEIFQPAGEAQASATELKFHRLVPGGERATSPEIGLAILLVASLGMLWAMRGGFKQTQPLTMPINTPSALTFAGYLIIVSTSLRIVATMLADKPGILGGLGKGLSFAV